MNARKDDGGHMVFKPLAASLSFISGLEPADGKRRGLFERSEFRSRHRCGAKSEGNKRQRGSLFFPIFLLAKQKKKYLASRARATVLDCFA